MPSGLERMAAELASRIGRPVATNVPMSRYTTWRIGGPADLLVVPRSVEELETAVHWAGEEGLPVTVVGAGSNLLVLDGGIRGLVIRTAHGLTVLRAEDDRLIAGAGVSLPALVRMAVRRGWGGLEFLAGIPGTVGGAVVMNAGTDKAYIGERVRRVGLMDWCGRRYNLLAEDIAFSYRFSSLQEEKAVVIEVELEVQPGKDPKVMAAAVEQRLSARRAKQPYRWPSAGSVFKNPPGWISAGWLIEQVGAKGLTRGAAKVAEEHANFILNLGGATAEDVLGLIEEVRRRVKEKFGVELELEVRLVGEPRGVGEWQG